MKLAEFMEAAATTRMTQHVLDGARLVLVDGMKAVDAAKLLGMTPQQLQGAMKRIKAAHKAGQGIPDGWECVTVCVPPELVETVREVGRQAKRDAGLSVD
ncbi:TrfB-related DNA-binding protein (plasmid) [Thiothrix lacustris]|uniref:TrfB-related DNA-binding protein n=1 Tax=Thiothrix lacustris TaxID=525917 RepID=A0ABY9MUZ6_9GAMM|nr:TrfB-related DNA-binding protein [Thiothrix lacustris]WML92502.1 TrfB-related DNA-binding protein [Thiothrix lacustris]